MSTFSVSKMIKEEFNVDLSAQTIQLICSSPIRRGPKGNIPKRHYCNLLIAFKSFVTITQNNGGTQECRHKLLLMQLSKVIKTKDWT
jgi:hypothetical protein